MAISLTVEFIFFDYYFINDACGFNANLRKHILIEVPTFELSVDFKIIIYKFVDKK